MSHWCYIEAIFDMEANQLTHRGKNAQNKDFDAIRVVFLLFGPRTLFIIYARHQQVRRQLARQPIRSFHSCNVYSSSGQAESVCYCCSPILVVLKFQPV